jgi:outer membrane protein, heavy metal efflux system
MHGDYIPPSFIDCLFNKSCSLPLPRFLLTLFLASGLMTANAAEPGSETFITEDSAIQYALERPALKQTEDALIGIADSAILEKNTRPNPVLSIEHERLSAAAGSSKESSVMLSQSFDISGRRALGIEAAETRMQATQFEVKSLQLKTVIEVRQIFADALYRQQQLDAHRIWLLRITSITDIVSKLADGGEASGYDKRRLEREVYIAQSKLNAAEADASRARAHLAGLIARPVTPSNRLDGDLIPDSPPPLEKLAIRLEHHPDFARLEAQASAFERDIELAKRLKVPDVTLGIGTKQVREPGFSDNGLMLSMSIPIPVFDSGQAQEQQAKSKALMSQAERSIKLSRAQAELAGVWHQATQLRAAAIAFQNSSVEASQALSHIAETSYRAGEADLLALLDAYRSELEATAIKLDLSLRARLARIELDALTGVSQYE